MAVCDVYTRMDGKSNWISKGSDGNPIGISLSTPPFLNPEHKYFATLEDRFTVAQIEVIPRRRKSSLNGIPERSRETSQGKVQLFANSFKSSTYSKLISRMCKKAITTAQAGRNYAKKCYLKNAP